MSYELAVQAEKGMQFSGGVMQRKCDKCQKKEHVLQRAAVQDSVPPIVHEVLRSPGQPLDATARGFMETRFGHDFSRVRVHRDAKAMESARAVDALAYTVGNNMVFARSNYASNTTEGRRLLAHELTHVVQQTKENGGGRPQCNLMINQQGDAFEQESDAAARRIVDGEHAIGSLSSLSPAIQRDTPDDAKKEPPEKKESGEVAVEGLKVVAGQAMDNNPKMKKFIEPIKSKLKAQLWTPLSTGEKAATIGWGAATLGIAGGGMLSDPGGRKQLEGVNLAAPLTLIPHMPLTDFKYILPTGEGPDKRLTRFETSFNADDLINLRIKGRGLPKMSLSASLRWGYDPVTDGLRILGGDATLGILPGLSVSFGKYKDILPGRNISMGPEGQFREIKKSIPDFGRAEPREDWRIMFTVDLMKLNLSDFKRQFNSYSFQRDL